MSRLTVCLRRVPPVGCLCSMSYARRSDKTDACHSQGAQATNREHPQAASCHTANDDGGKPGVRFLARSKRGTRSMPAWIIVGTTQRRRRYCASGWEESKEGAAVWWHSPKDGNLALDFAIGLIFIAALGTRHRTASAAALQTIVFPGTRQRDKRSHRRAGNTLRSER